MKKYVIFSSIFFTILMGLQYVYFSHEINILQSDAAWTQNQTSKMISDAIANNNSSLEKKITILSDKVDSYAKSVYELQNELSTTPVQETQIPSYDLTLDENYTVTKREVTGGAMNVTWVIIKDDESPVEQIANENEQFSYDTTSPGHYTLYLKAFYDGTFHTVSNVVTYTISETQEKTGA